MWIMAAAMTLAQPTALDPMRWRHWTGRPECIADVEGCDEYFDKRIMRAQVARIEASARQGDVLSMRAFGMLLWRGQWVPKDRGAALGWFYESAIRNDPLSMHMLGRAFQRGEGVAPDPKLAAFWLKRAADRGYTGAGLE